MSLHESEKQAFQDAENKFKRGDYYLEKENYDQALQEYAETLNHFSLFLQCSDLREKNKNNYSFPRPDRDTQIGVLLWLAAPTREIITCYIKKGEYAKAVSFIKDLKEIIEVLSQYQRFFNVDILKAYESYSQELTELKLTVALGKELTEYQDENQPIDNSDSVFSKLRSKFDSCTSYETCLLPSREVTIVTDSNNSIFYIETKYRYIILSIGVILTIMGQWFLGLALVGVFFLSRKNLFGDGE